MLRHATALSTLLFAAAASAQVSGSAALVSDDRFRGLSLSDGQPAEQLTLAYDGNSGWYAGALASSVRPAHDVHVQLLGYLGIARPIDSSLSWEAGAEYATIVGRTEYNYPELYLGLASDRYSVRLSYARHYFGQPAPALYAAIDRNWRLSDRLRLLGHLGLLRRNGYAEYASSHYRADARVGLALTWRDYHLQLAWTIARGSEAPYPFGYEADALPARQAWVFSCSRSW